MRRYYKKKAYYRLSRTQAIGRTHGIGAQTAALRPNRRPRLKPKNRKCDECGTAASSYVFLRSISQKPLCLRCYRKLSIKK